MADEEKVVEERPIEVTIKEGSKGVVQLGNAEASSTRVKILPDCTLCGISFVACFGRDKEIYVSDEEKGVWWCERCFQATDEGIPESDAIVTAEEKERGGQIPYHMDHLERSLSRLEKSLVVLTEKLSPLISEELVPPDLAALDGLCDIAQKLNSFGIRVENAAIKIGNLNAAVEL